MKDRLSVGDISRLQWIESLCSPAFDWNMKKVQLLFATHEWWGWRRQDEVVACVAMIRLPDAWEIALLATHPQAQRRGYMRSLLGELIEAKRQEAEIWLEVHEKNQSAQTLYATFGFVQVARRPGYYSDAGAALLLSLKKQR